MVVRPVRTAAAAIVSLLALLAFGAGGAAARTAHAVNSTAALDSALTKDLKVAGGSSSALVVDESTGQTLFSENPTTPRLPASVEKLFTTSSALFDFGSGYKFQTDIYGVGTLSNGVFTGTLYLKGGGDPTFGDQHFNAVMYGGQGASVQALAKDLYNAGVHTIKGAIVGDASIFDGLGGGPDTGYRANLETEGELSGLSYDAGFTSSSEAKLQPNPSLWATKAFASVAKTEGITIAKGTRLTTGKTPTTAKLLTRVYSPPVSELLKLTNAPSDNFFAETLDKDLGAHLGTGGGTTAGANVVSSTISSKLGVSERTNDGSGLSRYDRTTATGVVELLEEMQPSTAFYSSLAVAGVSGTMVDEMLGTPGANNCRGKTGTLHDVANLVGYCTAANGNLIVFAFLENSLGDSTYGHETEDVMGEALASYSGNGTGTAAPTLPKPNAGAAVPTVAAGASSTSGTTTSGTTTTGTTGTTSTTNSSSAGSSSTTTTSTTTTGSTTSTVGASGAGL